MFQIEYDGQYHEAATLNAALDWAKQLVADSSYRLDGCTIEQDELTNTWYVQGVVDGNQVGAAVVISGPDAGTPPPVASHEPEGTVSSSTRNNHRAPADTEFDGWSRLVVISGTTPAEVFGKVAGWLADQRSPVHVTAVRPITRRPDRYFALEVYFDEPEP